MLLTAIPLAAALLAAPVDTPFTIVELTPAQGALAPLLAAAVREAEAKHETPVVEFGATWCGPCKRLAASLGDARMIDAFRGVYLIRLDLDAWRGKLTGTKIPEVGAIPAFYALRHDGTTTGETINGGAWGDDIPENMAPPLKAYFASAIQHFTSEPTAAR
jgi:thiol-disulfide isomerase/thioredoxin